MKHPKYLYGLQIIAAAILFTAAAMKFVGNPDAIHVFQSLGMEPQGRYIIGILEFFTALFLLSPLAALGSVLSVSIMCGAIIAHVTKLGLVVNHDDGLLVGMLIVELFCSAYILIVRRKEIPFIGETF